MRERLRLAVPNKGRLVEPTLALLHDAGLVFEEHDRSLVARVQNLPIDILFVRTNDVIEFVGDGVADLGITGQDLLAETGAELPVLRPLGYGRCRLAAAVPADAAIQDDRRPGRPASRHRPPGGDPAVLRRARASRSTSSRLSGAVEVAPRLGLAEAIVDLVSTGSTLAMNGLRAIGDVLPSEAILVGRSGGPRRSGPTRSRAVDTMLASVIAARGRKYLMMNAPSERLPELEAILPGLDSPSVIPLAHAGMIAIHAVVDADAVWSLLPRLRARALRDPRPADREDRRSERVRAPPSPRGDPPRPARPRPGGRRSGRGGSPRARSSAGERSPTRRSARAPGRSSPRSGPVATRPSGPPTRGSAADWPTAASSSSPPS